MNRNLIEYRDERMLSQMQNKIQVFGSATPHSKIREKNLREHQEYQKHKLFLEDIEKCNKIINELKNKNKK